MKCSQNRYETLLSYCLGLAEPATNRDNLERARALFESVTPFETILLVDQVVETVSDIEMAKTIVTRMLHSFTKSLSATKRPFPRDIPFIEEIVSRNDEIEEIMGEMKKSVTLMNEKKEVDLALPTLSKDIERLITLTNHYTAKENMLFPIVESHILENRCLQIMWAIHDDIRSTLASLHTLLGTKEISLTELNALIGRLFFDLHTMIYREEQILFPVMIERIDRSVLLEIGEGQHSDGQVDPSLAKTRGSTVDLITGNPTASQLIQIFNALPVDITLVDQEDKVVYFNTPEHRIFPRAKAVVGRSVQNCHPPTSLHIVEEIVEAFRSKKRREAEFRITMKGRYVLIRYIALYDESDTYVGTLEVSQDITDIQPLRGEKRLLEWATDQ